MAQNIGPSSFVVLPYRLSLPTLTVVGGDVKEIAGRRRNKKGISSHTGPEITTTNIVIG
jgi:hypothetical protein